MDNCYAIQSKTASTQGQQMKGNLDTWATSETCSFFFTGLILLLFDHVEFCDWAVIKWIFPAHHKHPLVAQRGSTSHPLFSISLVYTPFFWRSCCLTLPVSSNCPSYSLDFRLLVAHQWQLTAKHIHKALYSAAWIPKALGSNLLRQRKGFEIGTKDCVLTKKEQVFLSFPITIVRMSVCLSFKSEEKFVFHSENWVQLLQLH